MFLISKALTDAKAWPVASLTGFDLSERHLLRMPSNSSLRSVINSLEPLFFASVLMDYMQAFLAAQSGF